MRVERVLAPNPGPYTGPGTNTYVVSAGGSAVVIDPGPIIDTHMTAIEHALDGAAPVAVLVTHTHPDHAPAANPLGSALGVPVLGFAPGPEFDPTDTLADGDVVHIGAGTSLTAVHTPGHTADHLCYLAGAIVFSGDHVISGSTVIIEDAADYLASLERVRGLGPDRLLPGHGDEIGDAVARIDAYIAHRIEREEQILAAVGAGADRPETVVEAVYGDVPEALREAAALQVGVQLRKLVDEGRVVCLSGTPLSALTLPTMEDR